MTNPYAPPSDQPMEPARLGRSDAAVALALATTSLFVCAPLTTTMALVYAYRSQKHAPSSMATVAIVLAVIGFVTSAFFWFLAVWQYLAPGAPGGGAHS